MINKEITLKVVNSEGNEIEQSCLQIKPGSLILIEVSDSMSIDDIKTMMNTLKDSLEGDNPALAYYRNHVKIQILKIEGE